MQGTFIILTEKQFHEITSKLDQIFAHLEGPAAAGYKRVGKWISEKETLQLLGKGKTTLWMLRTRGLVAFTKIGNSVFYDVGSIEKMLEKNSRKAFGERRR